MAHRIRLAALVGLWGMLAAAGPPPPGAPNPSFNLVNRTVQPIRELFVTSGGNANWGQNRLDGRNGNPTAIPVGGSYSVRRRADNSCLFDIKVVLGDGHAEEKRGVNTCAVEEVVVGAVAGGGSAPLLGPPTGKAPDDPSVKLFNRAAAAITEFYAVPAGGPSGDWGANRLQGPLAPDQNQQVTLARDGNCIFDLRVVFADKKAREKKRTNLCRMGELPVP